MKQFFQHLAGGLRPLLGTGRLQVSSRTNHLLQCGTFAVFFVLATLSGATGWGWSLAGIFLVVVSCLRHLLLKLTVADTKLYGLAIGWLLLVFAAFLVWLGWWQPPIWQRWLFAAVTLLLGAAPYLRYIVKHEGR